MQISARSAHKPTPVHTALSLASNVKPKPPLQITGLDPEFADRNFRPSGTLATIVQAELKTPTASEPNALTRQAETPRLETRKPMNPKHPKEGYGAMLKAAAAVGSSKDADPRAKLELRFLV